MSWHRKINYQGLAAFFIIALLSFSNNIFAQNGEQLYKANCAACHKIDKDFTGPMLKGARDREPDREWAYKWVNNVNSMIETDPYAKALKAKFGSQMTQFNLKKEEIKAILDYADAPPVVSGPKPSEAPAEDNSFLFGILTMVLAVVAFILLQVNSNLRKLSDEKEGVKRGEPVPFYKNKTYLMLATLVLFAIGGYMTFSGAVGLGRQKGYEPEQPIFYSHKVHAGINQISCLYCHGSAQDSKTAGIPSVNVCMNCHKGITKYEGEEKLVRADGTPVDGTAEIQKIYQYAGYNPATKTYNEDKDGDGVPDGARPIEWTRIHNLPDHVYFNHSQHVTVGKQQCQTCHGNITEMNEVSQFAELSMGWCVNCHRETKVNFYNKADSTGNKFYSIYEKFHQDMKPDTIRDVYGNIKEIKKAKMDSVTVANIGGTECQKCHY